MSSKPTPAPRHTAVGKGGRVVIPALYREALGLKAGTPVIVTLEDEEIRIVTPRRALARARNLVRQYMPKNRSLAKELIRERRAEAKRE
jgi:AbrB family looped-hinge helix DNA binding protein